MCSIIIIKAARKHKTKVPGPRGEKGATGYEGDSGNKDGKCDPGNATAPDIETNETKDSFTSSSS